ncbi:cuticle protein CP14.6-like [Toxorhynchites rutilus septentrionalis]|uniref:cuticle protein CP14.6-like n=1 Tax=Toxorhynchites rutilus septentrionalis TaxID=329112 RepID=UPI00247ACB82|nr:cuticle protein CP14.6-like [Toxorhynchites rutilus septentrionalis]
MYKKLYIASLLVAVAFAAPPRHSTGGRTTGDADATILAQDSVINEDGSYAYNYETSNGIRANQRSQDGIRASGQFGFVAPEGVDIQLSYTADENGFVPQGAHLPIEPPAPDHVIKLLQDLRATNNRDFDLALLDSTIARLKATQG